MSLTLKDYQEEGVRRLEAAGGRAILADAVGLGKTIQYLTYVDKNSLYPLLIITKSSLLNQLINEINKVLSIVPYEIRQDEEILKDPKIYVSTYYNLSYIHKAYINWSLIVFDEGHRIGSYQTNDSINARKLSRQSKHCIVSTATPVKNTTVEFWGLLDTIKPNYISSPSVFERTFLKRIEDENGYVSYNGIKDSQVQHWAKLTKRFIIRRTREDVLKELPKRVIKIRKVTACFNKFWNDYEHTLQYKTANELRALCGLAKVVPTFDLIKEHLKQNLKVIVFYHFRKFRENLSILLRDDKIIHDYIDGSIAPEERYRTIIKFQHKENFNVLLLSSLSSCEGLNLQFCGHIIVAERQWNSANEDQAEGRIIRLGSEFKNVLITYVILDNSYDNRIEEIISDKDEIVQEVI